MSPIMGSPYRFGGHVPGSGYGWSPASVAGLVFWWRADQTPALSQTVDSITQIDDQSGNANHGTWTANKAHLVTNVTGSLPAIRFTGSGAIYTFPTNMMTGKTAAHIFAALICEEDTPATRDNCGLWQFSGSGSAPTFYPDTDASIYDGFSAGSQFNTGNPSVALNTWHRLAVKGQSSGYEMRINGASHFSNGTSCGSDWLSATKFGQSKTGVGQDFRFKGYLLDLFAYDSVLSGTDRGLAETYLADRISGTWYAS